MNQHKADPITAQGTGAGDWTAAYIQARAFVAQLTNEEKWNLTAGMSANNSCSGNINAIPRLGFPGLCLSDAGNGLVSCRSYHDEPHETARAVLGVLQHEVDRS